MPPMNIVEMDLLGITGLVLEWDYTPSSPEEFERCGLARAGNSLCLKIDGRVIASRAKIFLREDMGWDAFDTWTNPAAGIGIFETLELAKAEVDRRIASGELKVSWLMMEAIPMMEMKWSKGDLQCSLMIVSDGKDVGIRAQVQKDHDGSWSAFDFRKRNASNTGPLRIARDLSSLEVAKCVVQEEIGGE